ncbi:MAG: lipoyl(octanoyl) transferase LipB [Candidatus Zixiibacteriota bacterium]
MCSREFNRLFKIELGRTKYKKAWEIQKKLVKIRAQEKIPDCLLVTEHDPVITMGRGASKKNLLVPTEQLKKKKIELYEVERGGDITFHGPGQIVLYPILDLHERGQDVHQYLRDLEHFIIMALQQIGLEAYTKKGLTGIWVNSHKIGAIGVAVSRWVTYHGLALNVNTDMKYFDLINPCGITDHPVGSIAGILGVDIEMEYLSELLVENFADLFYYEVESIDSAEDLIAEHSAPDRIIEL